MSDLTELFSRDPLKYTDQDLDEIVEKLRAARHQFNAGNMKAGSTKPKSARQKQAEELADTVNLDLKNLL